MEQQINIESLYWKNKNRVPMNPSKSPKSKKQTHISRKANNDISLRRKRMRCLSSTVHQWFYPF
jgi:hypothetical protein